MYIYSIQMCTYMYVCCIYTVKHLCTISEMWGIRSQIGGGRVCKSNNHSLMPHLKGVILIPMKGYIVKTWGRGLSNSSFYLSRT